MFSDEKKAAEYAWGIMVSTMRSNAVRICSPLSIAFSGPCDEARAYGK